MSYSQIFSYLLRKIYRKDKVEGVWFEVFNNTVKRNVRLLIGSEFPLNLWKKTCIGKQRKCKEYWPWARRPGSHPGTTLNFLCDLGKGMSFFWALVPSSESSRRVPTCYPWTLVDLWEFEVKSMFKIACHSFFYPYWKTSIPVTRGQTQIEISLHRIKDTVYVMPSVQPASDIYRTLQLWNVHTYAPNTRPVK